MSNASAIPPAQFSNEVRAYLKRQGLELEDVEPYGANERGDKKRIGYLAIPFLTRDGTEHEWRRWYGNASKKHEITPDSGDAIFIAPPPGKTVEDIKSAKVVVITESPIKAIIVARRAGYFAIAGNGCAWLVRKGSSRSRLHPHLAERLGGLDAMPKRGLLIIIALDADADTNQEVADAEDRLQQACERANVQSVVARLVPCGHPGHQCKDLGDVLAQHGPVPIGLMLGGAHITALRERQPVKLLRAHEAALIAYANSLRSPLSSGIEPLDKYLQGGFHPESVYVLAAPTGRGKTGFAIQIARDIGKWYPVVFLSAELTERQVLARFAAQQYGASWLDVYQGDNGMYAHSALRDLKLYVVTDRSFTAVKEQLQEIHPTPFLVIDYLQAYARRFPSTEGNVDPRVSVGNASLEIANWAREQGATALVVSSVSRDWHKAQGNKTASDYIASAKEAGEIEYDAAGVLYLDMEVSETTARLHVAKHRFGPSGQTIGLRFDGAVGLFVPDKEAALTEEQGRALQLIREGQVDSAATLQDAMKIRRNRAQEIVRVLKAQGLVRERGKKLEPVDGGTP